MGRPRKTSDSAASPRPAATAPKAASAAAQSSASSRTVSAKTRSPGIPAAKSESSKRGQGEKPTYASSPRASAQGYQTRASVPYSDGQGGTSRGAKAKTSAEPTLPTSSAKTSGRVQQAPSKTQSKATLSPISTEKVAEIERETRGQRENPDWHKWRENRITASVAPKIANSKFANGRSTEVPSSYLKDVVGSNSRNPTPAMSWGIRNERKAVRAYEELKSSEGEKPVKVSDCGLFVDKTKPWLAASPDGIVRDAATGKELGLLEVKCPYKHREKTVTEACKDKTFCLEKEGDSYALKKSHPYYTQLQTQMGVSGRKRADFVVHTKKETAIAPVDFDPGFWEKTVPKLEKFYTEAVIPHLEEKQSAVARMTEE